MSHTHTNKHAPALLSCPLDEEEGETTFTRGTFVIGEGCEGTQRGKKDFHPLSFHPRRLLLLSDEFYHCLSPLLFVCANAFISAST